MLGSFVPNILVLEKKNENPSYNKLYNIYVQNTCGRGKRQNMPQETVGGGEVIVMRFD